VPTRRRARQLGPACRGLEVRLAPRVLWEQSLVPYSVPLKGGDQYDTYVVSPFDIKSTAAQRNELTEVILSTFTGSIDVEVKKQNTKRFLEFASNRLEVGRPEGACR